MRALVEVADFLQRMKTRLRFGDYSRAKLRLLRFELRGETAECEWVARPNDPWDAGLPAHVRDQNQTIQALHDAINIRDALFKSMPAVKCARLRVYRQQEEQEPELIITGSVSREDVPPPRVASLAMRAMLYGLHFRLEDGALGPLS